jgi:hypothetical protein
LVLGELVVPGLLKTVALMVELHGLAVFMFPAVGLLLVSVVVRGLLGTGSLVVLVVAVLVILLLVALVGPALQELEMMAAMAQPMLILARVAVVPA